MGHRQSFHWDDATFTGVDDAPIFVFEITVRVADGEHLFRPEKALTDLVWGVVGKAQSKYAFELYAFHMLSNHYSLLIGVCGPERHTEVKRFINGNIAKEVNKLRSRSGSLQGRRSRSIQIDSDEVLLERLAYSMANGTAENLVARPELWPGPHFAKPVITGKPAKGLWYDRTKWWHAKQKDKLAKLSQFATTYTVRFDKLPALHGMSDAKYRATMLDLADRAADERKKSHTGQPLGAAKALSGSFRARTELKKRRGDKATKKGKRHAVVIHAATDERRAAYRTAYRGFVNARLEAAADKPDTTESPPAAAAA